MKHSDTQNHHDTRRNKKHSPPKTRQEFQETIMIDPVNLTVMKHGLSFAKTCHRAADNVSHAHDRGTGITEGEATPSHYATRLSTVLLIRRTGEVLFVERHLWLLGTDAKPELAKQDEYHERNFRFQVHGEGSRCKHHVTPVPFILIRILRYCMFAYCRSQCPPVTVKVLNLKGSHGSENHMR